MSFKEFLAWLARLGPAGAADNAREAVEANGRADQVSAELDERARLNGWARPAYSSPTTDAEQSLSA